MSKKKKNKQDELNPYAIDKFATLPALPKVLFMKWWLVGAIYYMAGFGIMLLNIGAIENAIVLGVIIGLFNEYIIKNVIKLMNTSKQDFTPHIEVRVGYTKGLVLNVIFGIVISITMMFVYELINVSLINLFDTDPTQVLFPAEPFSYGLIYLGLDYIYLGIRNSIIKK